MKIEPHADLRQAAAGLWQMFVALRDEGFTSEQALELIKTMLIDQREE